MQIIKNILTIYLSLTSGTIKNKLNANYQKYCNHILIAHLWNYVNLSKNIVTIYLSLTSGTIKNKLNANYQIYCNHILIAHLWNYANLSKIL